MLGDLLSLEGGEVMAEQDILPQESFLFLFGADKRSTVDPGPQEGRDQEQSIQI